MIVAGLMSGTSLDGIDAALLAVDPGAGQDHPTARHDGFQSRTIAYTIAERTMLEVAVKAALQWRFLGPAPDCFLPVARMLAEKSARIVQQVCADNGINVSDLDLVGFHGQTVIHEPPVSGGIGRTLQIGDAALLAQLLGVSVVHDFRTADMAMGGHGAPLAPAWHHELLRAGVLPSVFLNIGGVANLTLVQSGDPATMQAMDIGPGNGPLDAWVQHCGLGTMDRDGEISAAGRVHMPIVQQAMQRLPEIDGPISFDRWDFNWGLVQSLSPVDGAATLVAITVRSIARAIQALKPAPKMVVVGGGGRLNPTIMQGLRQHLPIPVQACEALGWDGDAIEAQAFAWLAALRKLNKVGSWPKATGVSEPVICGSICECASST